MKWFKDKQEPNYVEFVEQGRTMAFVGEGPGVDEKYLRQVHADSIYKDNTTILQYNKDVDYGHMLFFTYKENILSNKQYRGTGFTLEEAVERANAEVPPGAKVVSANYAQGPTAFQVVIEAEDVKDTRKLTIIDNKVYIEGTEL